MSEVASELHSSCFSLFGFAKGKRATLGVSFSFLSVKTSFSPSQQQKKTKEAGREVFPLLCSLFSLARSVECARFGTFGDLGFGTLIGVCGLSLLTCALHDGQWSHVNLRVHAFSSFFCLLLGAGDALVLHEP